jgi:dipeptidyl aminopeptidase/acylaminoacyl peptidase
MEQNGGDWRVTTADVLLAANFVLKLDAPVDATRVVVMGFSAGGHLALWLASQKQRLALRGAISLAGVADLRRAEELQLSSNVTRDFLGADPNYLESSPIERLPFGIPTRLILGTEDDTVPYEIGVRFEKAARAAGDDCRLVRFAGGGHTEVADPLSKEWPAVQASILDLLSYV